MNIVIGTSIGSAALVYEIIAVFGYLTFGSKVSQLVIEDNGAPSEFDFRLAPTLSQCIPPPRYSLQSDNWPLPSL